MTVDEVAKCLKLKPEIVRRKVRYGQIRGYKVGKCWRFYKSDIKNFLAGCLS